MLNWNSDLDLEQTEQNTQYQWLQNYMLQQDKIIIFCDIDGVLRKYSRSENTKFTNKVGIDLNVDNLKYLNKLLIMRKKYNFILLSSSTHYKCGSGNDSINKYIFDINTKSNYINYRNYDDNNNHFRRLMLEDRYKININPSRVILIDDCVEYYDLTHIIKVDHLKGFNKQIFKRTIRKINEIRKNIK